MLFPKVFILTLLIVGTFAKGSIENMEERIEALERKLAACTMADELEDFGTNRGVTMANFVSFTYFLFKVNSQDYGSLLSMPAVIHASSQKWRAREIILLIQISFLVGKYFEILGKKCH